MIDIDLYVAFSPVIFCRTKKTVIEKCTANNGEKARRREKNQLVKMNKSDRLNLNKAPKCTLTALKDK